MKTSICTNKLKIFTVITLVLIVVGMALFGVFGFNQTVDYSSAYETNIKVEQNINKSGDIAFESAKTYYSQNGVKYVSYAVQKINDNETIIFKFDKNTALFSDKQATKTFNEGLETYIESQLKDIEGGLDVTVSSYSTVHTLDNQIGWICLAVGIAICLIFIYALLLEKLSGALAVLIVGLISAILDFALIAITRVPAEPFVLASVIASAVIGMVLSVVIVNRCNELLKSEENKKLTYGEIAAKGTNASKVRMAFIAIAILIISVLFIALGPTYLRWLGVQLAIAGTSSIVVAFGWTDFFWAIFKSYKKDRKSSKSLSEVPTETVEK